jgi:predicted DNA-binding transcriptional regulator YafY
MDTMGEMKQYIAAGPAQEAGLTALDFLCHKIDQIQAGIGLPKKEFNENERAFLLAAVQAFDGMGATRDSVLHKLKREMGRRVTDREKWLLSEASTAGRRDLREPVELTQYEELRALANKLLEERNRQMDLRMADHAEVVFTGGKW